MIYLSQHGLDRRLLPTQGVEPNLVRVEIELRADQAVGPPRIDRIAPFQQTHRPTASVRRTKMIRPRGWACRSNRQGTGKARRDGAVSIRSERRACTAATKRSDCCRTPFGVVNVNRAQTFACHRPL